MEKTLPITAIIHVKNEEINLPFTLKNINGKFNQVVVVDSESDDNTQKIALSHRCELISRKCTRKQLVNQRNWALDTINFKNEWVFIIDGDEIIEDDLWKELFSLDFKNSKYDAFAGRWKNIFLGKWIKYSSFYPTWSIRLFKHKIVRYEERSVNAHPIVEKSKLGRLKGHFANYDRRGFGVHYQRTMQFSNLEAIAQNKEVKTDISKDKLANVFNSMGRRRILKLIFSRLPFRPLFLFIYLYIFRFGFLDGRLGLRYIILKVIQEWATTVHMRELKNKNN